MEKNDQSSILSECWMKSVEVMPACLFMMINSLLRGKKFQTHGQQQAVALVQKSWLADWFVGIISRTFHRRGSHSHTDSRSCQC